MKISQLYTIIKSAKASGPDQVQVDVADVPEAAHEFRKILRESLRVSCAHPFL